VHQTETVRVAYAARNHPETRPAPRYAWAITAMLARRRNHHEGTDLVRSVLGARITGVRRYVFLLGRVNDENGHGITELMTDATTLAFGVGPNDESIVVAPGPVAPGDLDPTDWTPVITDPAGRWNRLRGRVVRFIDVFTNGLEDVAFVFNLDRKDCFSVALIETNLVLARRLEPFRHRGNRRLPRFRDRIQ
jgi:hypothetical protein